MYFFVIFYFKISFCEGKLVSYYMVPKDTCVAADTILF